MIRNKKPGKSLIFEYSRFSARKKTILAQNYSQSNLVSLKRDLVVRFQFVSDLAREIYGNKGPVASTEFAAAVDMRACFSEKLLTLEPKAKFAVPLGVRIQSSSKEVVGLLCSRSGLGGKQGVAIPNGLGVIDPDYTGEVIALLMNNSDEIRQIKQGERVAQLLFVPFFRPLWLEEALEETSRAAGGFGHSGKD